MNFSRLIIGLCWMSTGFMAIGQTAARTEEAAVLATTQKVFDGMRQSDTTLFKSAFHPTARILSTMTQNDATIYQYESVNNFVQAIARPHTDVWDERVTDYEVRIDDGLAMVWMNYAFYVGTKFTHCGVNTFTLLRTAEGWKIIELADTRRIAPCGEQKTQEIAKKSIDQLLDGWHKAAAVADEDAFFGAMTADAIYLGTDATERWLRDELKEWSKDYFKKETAWAFTAKKRQVYFHVSGNIAWFEESLDTWMGECRGSGIVTHEPDGWKIRHYNLSLPIANDKMKSVIELLKGRK